MRTSSALLGIACLFLLPKPACAWGLSVGGGVDAGLVPGTRSAEPVLGWRFLTQWSRTTGVGRRLVFDVGVGQFATRAGAGGLSERGRETEGLLVWQRRLPFSYRIRPWLGLGIGVSHYRFDDRVPVDGAGFGVGAYPAVSQNDLTLGAELSVPLSRNWSVNITSQTGFPTRISTVTMTVLWRLF